MVKPQAQVGSTLLSQVRTLRPCSWKGPESLVQTLEEGQVLIGLLCGFRADEKSFGTGDLTKDHLSGYSNSA